MTSTQLQIRIDSKLKQSLQAKANAQGLTASEVVKELIARYVEGDLAVNTPRHDVMTEPSEVMTGCIDAVMTACHDEGTRSNDSVLTSTEAMALRAPAELIDLDAVKLYIAGALEVVSDRLDEVSDRLDSQLEGVSCVLPGRKQQNAISFAGAHSAIASQPEKQKAIASEGGLLGADLCRRLGLVSATGKVKESTLRTWRADPNTLAIKTQAHDPEGIAWEFDPDTKRYFPSSSAE